MCYCYIELYSNKQHQQTYLTSFIWDKQVLKTVDLVCLVDNLNINCKCFNCYPVYDDWLNSCSVQL